jgi:hypothetical protein
MKDDWDGRPREPICPSFCRFRLICRRWHQQGINPLFVEGRIERKAEACFPWFEVMTHSLERRFGIDASGMTAEEVFEAVSERIAMEDAS